MGAKCRAHKEMKKAYQLTQENMEAYESKMLSFSGVPADQIEVLNVKVGDFKGEDVNIHTLKIGDFNDVYETNEEIKRQVLKSTNPCVIQPVFTKAIECFFLFPNDPKYEFRY